MKKWKSPRHRRGLLREPREGQAAKREPPRASKQMQKLTLPHRPTRRDGPAISCVEDFLALLSDVRKRGAGYSARCPAHDDTHPSLDVDLRGGKILPCCRAGCSHQAVCRALGVKPRD